MLAAEEARSARSMAELQVVNRSMAELQVVNRSMAELQVVNIVFFCPVSDIRFVRIFTAYINLLFYLIWSDT